MRRSETAATHTLWQILVPALVLVSVSRPAHLLLPKPDRCSLLKRIMKRLLLLLLLVRGISPSSFANLGESEAAIEDRYGKSFGQIPTNTFGVMNGFIALGYVIGVKFVDGVSEMEMFSKANQADMPASEIDKLLKGNSPGIWKAELTGKPHWRRWRRDDGTAVALYDAVRHFLYINSKNFYEIKGQQVEQQEWNLSDHAPDRSPETGTTAIPVITATPMPSASPSGDR